MRITDQEANRLRVLKAIRRAEPVARAELIQSTGLSSQSISDVVAELLERNLLVEAKAPASGPGRPRTLLRISPDATRAVGAFIFSDGRLVVEIANLRGDRLSGATVRLAPADSLESLAPMVAAGIEQVLNESRVSKGSVHSVGLGVPAVIDGHQGVVHWMPRFPEPPYPLAQQVSARLGVPVLLDSSGDLLTRAEHWFGEDRLVDDFALIFVGLGIGLGQYVDGLLRSGAHGMSSAFAHVKVFPAGGPRCMCGAEGCLTTLASVSGVVARISEMRGRPSPRLAEMLEALQVFAREAREGDERALEVFKFAGRALGVAAANHINVLDPARLIVLVQHEVFAEMIAEPFRAAVATNILPAVRDRVPVQIRVQEDLEFAKGAAALVLEQLYRSTPAAIARGPAMAAQPPA